MTHISSGSGGGGIVIPDSSLHINHVENIVLHTDTDLTKNINFTDATNSESWAKDDGSGLILLDKGVYTHILRVGYTQCTLDCDFFISLYGTATFTFGVYANFHVPANTNNVMMTSGINVFSTAQGLQMEIAAGNDVDPTFTITHVVVDTMKLA